MFPISLWFMAHAVASVAHRICHLLREKKPSRSSGCCLLGRFLRFRLLDDSKRNWGSVNGLFYVSGPTLWLWLTHASNTFTLAPAAQANTSSSDLNGFSPQHLGINLCFFHVIPADAPWREGSEEARFGEVIMAVTELSLNGLSVTNAPGRHSANIVLAWTIFLWSHKSVVSDPPPGTNRSDTIYGLF